MFEYFATCLATIPLSHLAIAHAALVFSYMFYRAHKKERLDWVDMITRDGEKVSLTKVLQLVGGVTATWIIIKMAASDNLNWDMFMLYLAYTAGIEGYSKLMMAKYGVGGKSDSDVPTTPATKGSAKPPAG